MKKYALRPSVWKAQEIQWLKIETVPAIAEHTVQWENRYKTKICKSNLVMKVVCRRLWECYW